MPAAVSATSASNCASPPGRTVKRTTSANGVASWDISSPGIAGQVRDQAYSLPHLKYQGVTSALFLRIDLDSGSIVTHPGDRRTNSASTRNIVAGSERYGDAHGDSRCDPGGVRDSVPRRRVRGREDRDGAGLRPVQRGPGGPADRQAHRAAAMGGGGD